VGRKEAKKKSTDYKFKGRCRNKIGETKLPDQEE
jgi:hypothetical protein